MLNVTACGLVQEHINSFVRPTLSDMREESSFQFVQVSEALTTLLHF